MRTKHVLLAMSLSLLMGAASTPNDYAQQWPVEVKEEGAYAIHLNEEIYRFTQANNLSDVAAFNAKGESLPFGPMPQSYEVWPAAWRAAKAFHLPSAQLQKPEQLRLYIQKSTNGDVSFDAQVSDGNEAPAAAKIWLIDVQGSKQTLEGIQFQIPDSQADFTAQYNIDASDDLEQWQSIKTATIMSLQQNGQRLQRLTIELPNTEAKYLRVQSIDNANSPKLTGFNLKLRQIGLVAPLDRQWLQADFIEKDGKAFIYELPAGIPAEQLNMTLANANNIAEFSISARSRRQDAWQTQTRLTVFQLRAAGVSLDNEPAEIQSYQRMRLWRLETDATMDQPPVLKFAYRPERWLLLTHGPAPYTLVAGNAGATPNNYPLQAMLTEVKQRANQNWQPAHVEIGKAMKQIKPVSIAAYTPDDKKNTILWAVLIVGVLFVVGLVLKLLSQKRDETQ
jgi:Protein of unknown function (DUF3999)/F5/8 type C domain